MSHISAERLRELGRHDEKAIVTPLTQVEKDHTMQCDYCMEGVLLGDDPEEYHQRNPRYSRQLPGPKRPKD